MSSKRNNDNLNNGFDPRKRQRREEDNSGAGPSSFQCHYCSMRFESQQEMKQHENQTHSFQSTILRCQYCNYTSDKQEELRQHQNHVHPHHNLNNKCPYCSYITDSYYGKYLV